MIIQMDRYRNSGKTGQALDTNNTDTVEMRRLFGNTVPKLSLREIAEEARRSASQMLPDCFEDFNARDFIVNAYGLATQI